MALLQLDPVTGEPITTADPVNGTSFSGFSVTQPPLYIPTTVTPVPYHGDGAGVVPSVPGPSTPDYGTPSPLPPLPNPGPGGGILDTGAPRASTSQISAPPPATAKTAPYFSAVAPSREVQDNELVANQMNSLLSSDSPYIMNARRRGSELANRRGQFMSSLFAGTAERSAIESALPIAVADAQAYRDAATQNLAALTQIRIANLDSNTRTSLGNLDASTRVGIANLDAFTRTNIANLDAKTQTNIANMQASTQVLLEKMQSALQLEMQHRNINHERELANFDLNGKLKLAELDADLQMRLQERGFAHDVNIVDLDAANKLELQTIVEEYALERSSRDNAFQERGAHVNSALGALTNYTNYLVAHTNVEMDANAAARVQAQADAYLQSNLDMINALFPNQPQITIEWLKTQPGG